MIAKKNPRLDLERKRIVFFPLGLLTMTAATLAAFTYSSPLDAEREKQQVPFAQLDYVIEQQEKPEDKPEIVQPQQPQQPSDPNPSPYPPSDPSGYIDDRSRQVGNDPNSKPNLGIGAPNLAYVGDIGIQTFSDPIAPWPDKEAAYVGGFEAMQVFISKTVNYPQESIEVHEEGIVYVKFVVEKDGSISNVTIERGVSTALDREAKRIVKNFPKWIPGEVKAEPARTYVMMPIRFKLD